MAAFMSVNDLWLEDLILQERKGLRQTRFRSHHRGHRGHGGKKGFHHKGHEV